MAYSIRQLGVRWLVGWLGGIAWKPAAVWESLCGGLLFLLNRDMTTAKGNLMGNKPKLKH